MEINFDDFDTLSFDCYGTLIDWERGILSTLSPLLEKYGHFLGENELLENYAIFEAKVEQPYQAYKEVLKEVVRQFANKLCFEANPDDIGAFSSAVQYWPAFPDSTESLKALQSKYRLIILSNIDDKLFQHSQMKLGVEFDEVITSEQLRSYKPNPNNFVALLDRCGTSKEKLLHVAQSRFHDIRPAMEAGIKCAWIDRRFEQEGHGATLPSDAIAHERFSDLASFAKACGAL